jgi:dolichol-phosphate mannosyltransferase
MRAVVDTLARHPRCRQFIQFCLVGGSGVVVDMLVLHFLVDARWLGWHVSLGKLCSAEVAMINNFLWNECWTFGELSVQRPRWSDRLGRLGKFHVICGSGILLSVGLVSAQVYGLGWNVYLANALAIGLVSLWNFFLNVNFSWRGTGGRGPAE